MRKFGTSSLTLTGNLNKEITILQVVNRSLCGLGKTFKFRDLRYVYQYNVDTGRVQCRNTYGDDLGSLSLRAYNTDVLGWRFIT